MRYIEVILPLAVSNTFTYAVPDYIDKDVQVGMRVTVPFGRKNFYTGIVSNVYLHKPDLEYELKEIIDIPDDYPIVINPQLKLWEWIRDYYLCHIGEVFRAAIPSGLKVESETFLEPNPDFDTGELNLKEWGDKEMAIYQYLAVKGKTSLSDLEKGTGLKNIGNAVNSLLDKGIIIISEKLTEKYRKKIATFVSVADITPEGIARAFTQVKKAPQQEKLLLHILKFVNETAPNQEGIKEIDKSKLFADVDADLSVSAFNALFKKGIITVRKTAVNRFDNNVFQHGKLPVLSPLQADKLKDINSAWLSNQVVLLHGVTSSGKTEIYQHLIHRVLEQGEQVLMLVPEIALTTQLTKRMKDVFGDKVLIYHSKFSDSERVDLWRKTLTEKGPKLIIGARSAVFLPFHNLRLVIVDEEHESSYKQFDPAPRYNARDVAIVLASMHGAKTLLGSATPSVETYSKAKSGKFGLVELLERYDGSSLPDIETEDMTLAYKKNAVSGAFSLKTLASIRDEVNKGKQVIVFQNRRGYAPVARCKMCAWVPKCRSCDVSLTYHKNLNSLVCHYCGYSQPLPSTCPQCGEPAVNIHGYGTERIEDDIVSRIPDAKVARMDLDTTRNKDSYSDIIDDFSQGKSDILIGTQMVTKGLDFGGVSLVSILNADTLINFPDFRANERAFNMMEQVAGRAGRRGSNRGKVVVQAFDPEHPVMKYLKNHDYQGFYDYEIEERRKFNYPPFTRIINIYIKHKDENRAIEIAGHYASMLRTQLHSRVFGPDEPLVSRIQSYYIRRIMLKFEPAASMKGIKDYLWRTYVDVMTAKRQGGTIIYFDVDPA